MRVAMWIKKPWTLNLEQIILSWNFSNESQNSHWNDPVLKFSLWVNSSNQTTTRCSSEEYNAYGLLLLSFCLFIPICLSGKYCIYKHLKTRQKKKNPCLHLKSQTSEVFWRKWEGKTLFANRVKRNYIANRFFSSFVFQRRKSVLQVWNNIRLSKWQFT